MLTAADAWINALALGPNPEGGSYRLHHEGPALAGADRPLITVIYYLLSEASPRACFHRMEADAIHYHHVGGALRIHTLHEGAHEVVELGPEAPQQVVMGGRWKAIELASGPFALISEAVVPGWVPRDHERAGPELLRGLAPALAARLAPFVGGAR